MNRADADFADHCAVIAAAEAQLWREPATECGDTITAPDASPTYLGTFERGGAS
jgi:hypothetical protein